MNATGRKLAFLFIALLLGTAVIAPGAHASRGWCRMDPVIMVDGQAADVFVGSTTEMLLKATGPIRIEILIPRKSSGSVILTDAGFGHGYEIVFKASGSLKRTATHTQIKIRVYAPASTSTLPVSVNFSPRSTNSSLSAVLFGTTRDGYANSWISLATG